MRAEERLGCITDSAERQDLVRQAALSSWKAYRHVSSSQVLTDALQICAVLHQALNFLKLGRHHASELVAACPPSNNCGLMHVATYAPALLVTFTADHKFSWPSQHKQQKTLCGLQAALMPWRYNSTLHSPKVVAAAQWRLKKAVTKHHMRQELVRCVSSSGLTGMSNSLPGHNGHGGQWFHGKSTLARLAMDHASSRCRQLLDEAAVHATLVQEAIAVRRFLPPS